jgi:hypothetical protein
MKGQLFESKNEVTRTDINIKKTTFRMKKLMTIETPKKEHLQNMHHGESTTTMR